MNYDLKIVKLVLLCVAISLISPFAIKAKAVVSPRINAVERHQIVHVTGTVLDSNGEGVIGATVRVIGEKQATITDMDGKFKIDALAGAVLQISSIGYESQKVKVSSSPLRVIMAENSTMLKDVQVVAYGTQKKVTVTGAISGIKGSELLKTPVGSITNMLAGAVSGLSSIQYSGEPGADAATVLVRGKATACAKPVHVSFGSQI